MILGGLAASAVLNLLVLPVLYGLFAKPARGNVDEAIDERAS